LRRSKARPGRVRAGFSLIELLIVLTLMSILAATILTGTNPAAVEQLEAAARIVAADVAYCQSLAITQNSTYRLTFDAAQELYYLEHTGSDTSLDVLPPRPFHSPDDPPTRQTVRLADLPGGGSMVQLVRVEALGTPVETVDHVEFGPLGETTRPEETQIWLAAGSGGLRRLVPLRINPVTGTTTLGPLQTASP
jgi:prepilin-type N-terminal cleavage/methylation domain-containing protein